MNYGSNMKVIGQNVEKELKKIIFKSLSVS